MQLDRSPAIKLEPRKAWQAIGPKGWPKWRRGCQDRPAGGLLGPMRPKRIGLFAPVVRSGPLINGSARDNGPILASRLLDGWLACHGRRAGMQRGNELALKLPACQPSSQQFSASIQSIWPVWHERSQSDLVEMHTGWLRLGGGRLFSGVGGGERE